MYENVAVCTIQHPFMTLCSFHISESGGVSRVQKLKCLCNPIFLLVVIYPHLLICWVLSPFGETLLSIHALIEEVIFRPFHTDDLSCLHCIIYL